MCFDQCALIITCNRVDDDSIYELWKSIEKQSKLISLEMFNCHKKVEMDTRYLEDFPRDQGFMSLIPFLKMHPSLQTLDIQPLPLLTDNARGAFGELLQYNNPSLQSIIFRPFFNQGREWNSNGLFLLTDFLTNTIPRDSMSNKNLRKFHIYLPSAFVVPFAAQARFLDLFRFHNCSLEEFSVGGFGDEPLCCDQALQLSLRFYLRLNKLGRGRFQKDYDVVPKEVLVEALAEAGDDASCLFFLIHLNPAICNPS